MGANLKDWARAIKRDVHAIYLAAGDPRVPWYAKALALCVAGYALSPIDLVAVMKLIPPEIMAEYRAAAAAAAKRPMSRTAAAVILVIWIASMALIGWLSYRYWNRISSH
jgi:hypothetical protein